jgi:hypothetical protein
LTAGRRRRDAGKPNRDTALRQWAAVVRIRHTGSRTLRNSASGVIESFMVAVLPVTENDLPAACHFLARSFHAESASDTWMAAFRQQWAAQQPNYGFMLQDNGAIVGVIGAIYSDQTIRGRRERFCNINNWYVEPAYRRHSIMLLSRLLAQKDVHFTNFRPRPDLISLFMALKFQFVDDGRITYFLNGPRLTPLRRSEVLTDPSAAAAALGEADAKVFRDHLNCPGLKQVAVGSRADGFCHVAFYRTAIRHIPCILVLHVSDRKIFSRHLPALRSLFLFEHGAPIARIESRLLEVAPHLAIELKRKPHNVYLSSSLAPADVSSLYTEIAAMHAQRAA